MKEENMYGCPICQPISAMNDCSCSSLIGSKLPEISFDVFHEGKISKKSFSDFENNWLVLFFYPADFTFVCPTELGDLADKYEEFKKEGVEVLSFSTDTAFAHKAWHDASGTVKKVKFPMGSDSTADISNYFGVYIDKEGVALRGTFVANKEGVIKSVEVNDNSIGRSADELLRRIQAAKAVEENKGKVCPANWKPGDDMLKPSEELVGKI